MTATNNSAARQAAAIRAHARRGVWRRLLAALGVTAHTRAADARAVRWRVGGEGEQATAARLAPLTREGWHILHDRALPYSRANLDHVLIPPSAAGVIVLDTKRWHAQKLTRLVGGRVHCGDEDRHVQVEKVAGYARRVAAAVGVPGESVIPLLVVHGSRVVGGHLDVTLPGQANPVFVLDPDWMMSTLRGAASAAGLSDRQDAVALAGRVAQMLPPYRA